MRHIMRTTLFIMSLFVLLQSGAQIHVRYNQAGYFPGESKRAVVMSDTDIEGVSWSIKEGGTTKVSGTVGSSIVGTSDYTSQPYNYELDFSALMTEGNYTLEISGASPVPIAVKCSPYKLFIHQVLKTIRARRSGSNDAYIHEISHLGDASCVIWERNGSDNSNWQARGDGETADMLGGWYDAGDYIKFTLTSAYLTYEMLKAYEIAPELFDGVKDYSTTDLDDLLDEAKHGLDFLEKTMPEPGVFIIQTGGSADHNQGLRLPEDDALDGNRECYSALSKPQMGLTAAALALGARIFEAKGMNAQAQDYEDKAVEIYAAAKSSGTSAAWWQGGGEVYYADNNGNDNMELAAAELYKLTGTASYLTDAQNFGNDAGAAYWASWSSVNMMAHTTLLPDYSNISTPLTTDLSYFQSIGNATNNIWRAPHTSTWGTLYSYFSVANGSLLHQHVTGGETYQEMAKNVLDYTFGINPWGLSFVASEDLPNSITSTYAVMYRLQPSIFPTGEIAEGPTTLALHTSNRGYFYPAHDPDLWHDDFNTTNFTFFEQPGDYVCMETTIGGLADGLLLFSLASSLICEEQDACPGDPLKTKPGECGCGVPEGSCSATPIELPEDVLVGYWQNWSTMKLSEINPNYNVIQLAFATTKTGTDYDMEFNLPVGYTKAAFLNDIDDLHAEGKVVVLSIGGANDPVILDSESDKKTFVSSINQILEEYDYKIDGIDLDLESTSLNFGSWTMTSPAQGQLNVIDAVKEIMLSYANETGRMPLLTMAPETVYLQGGLSDWQVNNINGGAYLPIVAGLMNELSLIHPQYYNAGGASGGTFANDGVIYYDTGDPDYITALTETLIEGFTIKGGKGVFSGIAADKVAIGLPANECNAAGTGYILPEDVCDAMKYLKGEISKPSGWSYTLNDSYPSLRGLMTWSINEDALTCSGEWSFANIQSCLKSVVTDLDNHVETDAAVFPNPFSNTLHITKAGAIESVSVTNMLGEMVYEGDYTQDLGRDWSPGVYCIILYTGNESIAEKVVKR